jgi:outer membrane receptor protein involved in Fe transport
MRKIKLIVYFLLFFHVKIVAQLKGIVRGTDGIKKEAIYGARIKLLQSQIAVLTDESGHFELTLPKNLPDTLVIQAKGYNPDTLLVFKDDRFISLEIVLFAEKILPEVLIEVRRNTHSINRMKTLHVEELTSGELRKAACCNLSESFETNASVDVNITDAVSGAKKIQLMGLDGVYTQIQMENIPYLRGLESSFGLNSMSGTWIESIQITKGTGNVVNGYESMAGLINLELKKPDSMEKLFVNAYSSIYGREEINLNAGHKLNERLSTGWFAHASGMFGEMDNNKDGFRDVPMGNNLAFMNRWQYQGKKMEAQFGANAYLDQKLGGQLGYKSSSSSKYGVELDSRHLDAFAKTGFFMKKPYNSIGVVYNVKYQTVDALFGHRSFNGEEKRAYINAIFDGIIGTTDHKIKIGMSCVAVDLKQQLDTLVKNRREIVPGIFGEYTYTGMRFTSVVGSRLDYHNLFGWQFSPRLHAKYVLTEKTDLRFTAGKGWRVPNYMIDNISLLATSKAWMPLSDLKPEISWNIGGSFVQEMKLFKQKASFSLDFYHTQFVNQLIVDREGSEIRFSNETGLSYSNSFQGEFSFNLLKNWDMRFAYKYLDVKAKYGGEIQQQAMIPRNRALFNTGYKSRNKRWEYNLTVSVIGQSRLPGILPTDGYAYGKTYTLVNAQLTHNYKKWEFYLGGENLTNYIQKNAIVDAQNPFGSKFDATEIWAPVMGINIYAGLRFAIKRETKK